MEKLVEQIEINEQEDVRGVYCGKALVMLKKECYGRVMKFGTECNYKLPPCMQKGSLPFAANAVIHHKTIIYMK